MKIGDTVYHSILSKSDDGTDSYSKPIAYKTALHYMTVQETRGFLSTIKYGTDIVKYKQLVCQPYFLWKDKINEGDLFYIESSPDSDIADGKYGENADYAVNNVNNQNMGIIITLRKRS
jgi:hypothetical protein